MTRRTVALFAVFAAVHFLLGPGVEPMSAAGQPEPAACDPGDLDRGAGTHGDGLVPFSVLASGSMGDRREAGAELITDEAGWGKLRERGLVEDDLEAPDFSESAVLVVHAGRRPTAGYAVTVTRIRLVPEAAGADGPELLVYATVPGPPEGSMAATVITAPYLVVTLPADVAEDEYLTIDLQLL